MTSVAVVTGAASGMGRVTAQRLATHGWSVVAVDLAVEGLAWTEEYGHVLGLKADISTTEGNEAMVAAAEREFGGLDGAVLNAAVIAAGPIEELPIEELDRMYAVNVRGVVLGIRAVLGAFRRCDHGGAISVTSSMGGTHGEPYNWAYGSTKAAVINIVKSVALEVGHGNVRINALCPGPIQHTGMSAGAEQRPEIYERVRGLTALKRWGEPEEVARVHEFLLSDASSYVTGAVIVVDGGVTAGHSWTP